MPHSERHSCTSPINYLNQTQRPHIDYVNQTQRSHTLTPYKPHKLFKSIPTKTHAHLNQSQQRHLNQIQRLAHFQKAELVKPYEFWRGPTLCYDISQEALWKR